MMIEFYALAQQCAPHVEKQVMAGITRVESGFNPYAIGVVGGAIKQPRNLSEARQAVQKLERQGKNYSVGLSQVNKINFRTYGLTLNNMFDPCTNLRAGSSIFKKCFDRAGRTYGNKYSYDGKIRLASSCYYSGNFRTGFRVDFAGQPPYVDKVYNSIRLFRNNPNKGMNGYQANFARVNIRPTNASNVNNAPLPQNSAGLAQFATQARQPNQQPVQQVQPQLVVVPKIQTVSKPALVVQNLNGSSEQSKLISTDSTSSPNENKGKLNNSGDVFASPVLDIFNSI